MVHKYKVELEDSCWRPERSEGATSRPREFNSTFSGLALFQTTIISLGTQAFAVLYVKYKHTQKDLTVYDLFKERGRPGLKYHVRLESG